MPKTKPSKSIAIRGTPLDRLSPPHLAFALEYAENGNAANAMRQAGYAAEHVHANSTRLIGHDGIKAAVEYLHGLRVHAVIQSRQQLIADHVRVAYQAESLERLDTAIAARREVARLQGFYDEMPRDHSNVIAELREELRRSESDGTTTTVLKTITISAPVEGAGDGAMQGTMALD
jgi:hypothetical protein